MAGDEQQQQTREYRQQRERFAHAHGKRLACFRPRQRFRFVSQESTSDDDHFEHIHHADTTAAAAGVEDGEQGGEDKQQQRSRVATISKRKQKLQLKFAMEQLQLQQRQVTCDCEFQVFRCQLIHPDDSWAVLEENYLNRMKKWSEKFDAHDWLSQQERVCQKWKENQKRFVIEREEMERKDAQRLRRRTSGALYHSASSGSITLDEGDDPDKMSAGKAVKQVFSNFANAAESLLLSRQFDSLLRSGVPPHLRGRVWWMCSGAAEKQSTADVSYPELVKRLHTLSKCASMEIEKDLPRTFPVDQETDSEDHLRKSSMGELRRVLQAYSLRNPAIGYCQSMNFLAAVLLHHMEEEEAFWVLVAMVEELTPHYHTRSMSGSRADQRVFSDLVQQKLPQLYQHMRALGVDFEPFTLKWFLCLFLNTLPFEPVMRIWDVVFCEGSHVLLRVGLTLLKLNQPRILACDDAIEVYEMFKVSHETLQQITAPYRSGLLNRDECVCDTLLRLTMDKSFVGPIPFDSLHELRQFYRNEIDVEMAEMEAKRAASRAQQAIQRASSAAETATTSGSSVSSSEAGGRRSSSVRAATSTSPSRSDGDDDGDEDSEELFEYDFLDEFLDPHSETSPNRYIHFEDLYDSENSDYFIDVNYECAPCR
ncbi:Gtpase-activating protein [Globisporangium polare]